MYVNRLSVVIMHTLDVSNLYLEYGFNRVLWDACLHCETGEVVGRYALSFASEFCVTGIVRETGV